MNKRYAKKMESTDRKEDLLPKIFKLHEQNIHLLIAEIGGVFGITILLFHFLYIRRLPEFDLASSITLLGIISITGFTLIIFFSLTLVLPMIGWTLYVENTEDENTLLKLKERQSKKARNIGDYDILFGFPLISVLVLFLIWIIAASFIPSLINEFIVLLIFILITPIGWLTHFWIVKKRQFQKMNWTKFLFYQLILTGSVFLYLMTPAIVYIFYISRYAIASFEKNDSWVMLGVVAMTSTLCLMMNLALFSSFNYKPGGKNNFGIIKQLAGGSLLLLIVITLCQSFFSIPQLVLKLYGLADVENVEMRFKKEECGLIKQMNIRYLQDKDGESCVVRHSKILSAIGSDFFIETEDEKRFSFAKDKVEIVEIPASRIILTLTENIDAEGNLKNLSFEVLNRGGNVDKIMLFLSYYDAQGKLLKKQTLMKNAALEKGFRSEEQIALPAEIKNNNDVWRDAEISINGQKHWYKLVKKINIVE